MVEIQLRYGPDQIRLEIPEKNLGEVIQPRKQEASKDITGTLRQALETPSGITLPETISNRHVAVLIEDGTRAEPHEEILLELTPLLKPAKKLKFIIATGSHESNSMRNQEIIQAIHKSCKNNSIDNYRVIVHDALESSCKLLGTTNRGTTVCVNEEVLEVEAFVIAADMKNHYFAGYSNAIKNFLPGICDFSTIEANHSLALKPESTFGRHPFHPDPTRRTNPVAEDMLEAMKLILADRPTFLLATITSGPYILWSGSGDLQEVTREGIQVIDKIASFSVPKTGHIIVTPGGFPQDESLYNAQRGLELTKNAVEDNGEVLLLAECPKGIAPTATAREFFYDYLIMPVPEMMAKIQNHYRLYTHKSWKFGELIQRLRHIWLYTSLDRTKVETAHLSFSQDPQKTVDAWIEQDQYATIHVFHDANKIAVYATD
ncbi:MAG: lactate racemase domain-containing protein [Candidatus Thorarchaeota archaeon]